VLDALWNFPHNLELINLELVSLKEHLLSQTNQVMSAI
jgi:hypothetical protein